MRFVEMSTIDKRPNVGEAPMLVDISHDYGFVVSNVGVATAHPQYWSLNASSQFFIIENAASQSTWQR